MGCGIVTNLAESLGIKPGQNVLEDVSHNFSGADVSVKLTPIKAGFIVIQHKHDYPHLSVLMSGQVVVKTDNTSRILDARRAPVEMVIEAGVYHSVTAITDSLWMCIHTDNSNAKNATVEV
jgi:quercetin dioxygenase-like cupin family protein